MNSLPSAKICLIGGGGIRTPLVVYGINDIAKDLGVTELMLYDPDEMRVKLMAELGRAVVAREKGSLKITVASRVEEAIEGSSFVINSIRVGGIGTRAADERATIKHGYPGQETTGPAGAAMALRTIPVVIEQARLVEKLSPKAWIVSFTNPAGLITQAITSHTNAKVVGICDTPTELIHNLTNGLGATPDEIRCEYVGLNHLGWLRRITLRGEDITRRILADDALLRQAYVTDLFDPNMIRELGLIPTEYLYFYYCRRRALTNQIASGACRGAEVEVLNNALIETLSSLLAKGDKAGAIAAYEAYLNRRSGSYMRLEGSGGSAFDADATFHIDPFRVASGYHVIAMDVIRALSSDTPRRLIVNTHNRGTLKDLPDDDIIETTCQISHAGIVPEPLGELPDEVKGLVCAVKAYERAAIRAALGDDTVTDTRLAQRKALLIHPAIMEWEATDPLLRDIFDPICTHC